MSKHRDMDTISILILADEEAICSLLLCMKLLREPYWANSMISKMGPGNKHFNRFIEVSILYQRECISLTYSHTTNFPKLYFIILQIALSSHYKIPEFLKPNYWLAKKAMVEDICSEKTTNKKPLN